MSSPTATSPQQPPPAIPPPPRPPQPSPSSSSPDSTFGNPYSEVSLNDANRVQSNVSNTDYLLIKLIRPGHGTIRAVIGTLWHKLCTSLREQGILDNSKQNEFEQFVSTAVIIDRDTYSSLVFDAAQWRQHQIGSGHITGADSSGPDSSNRSPVSKASGSHDRKRTSRVR